MPNRRDVKGQVLPTPSTTTWDESMRLCLSFFEDAIRSVSKTPEELFEDFDSHLGVAWEARQEIFAGKPLLEWDHISMDKKEKIKELILAAEGMPKSAYAGFGMDDLSAPVWGDLRELASGFFDQP